MRKFAILCVDDEPVILDSLKAQLKAAFGDNYLYEMAESAEEALELLEELQEEDLEIVIIVSDWLMPGMKGDELLIQVHQKYPQIVKIMLTGQADPESIQRATELANLHCCLYKPWSEEELIKTINSALDKL
jgi:CheY-like chemotaxis protein